MNLNFKFLIVIFTFAFLLLRFNGVSASRIDELKQQITDRNAQIAEIQKEIEQYKKEIQLSVEESNTLKSQIKQLEASRNKLIADINLTQKQVDATEFNIERLNLQIRDKNEEISYKHIVLGEIIRNMNDIESVSLVEIALSRDNFSDFFGNLERMNNFNKEINNNLLELKNLKNTLEKNKGEKELYNDNLKGLKSQYIDQKRLVDINKSNKDGLLKETKNKEANYKKMLAEKEDLRRAFESELFELESQLKIEIDPSSIPSFGSGVLKWPLENISLKSCWDGGDSFKNCVTQFFGNTAFATQNPQIYTGGGHTGIDFRASTGDKVIASLKGVVEDIGDTDVIKGCYSYGKWVIIRHNNGLSTLYAHLSLIKVKKGQDVATGETVGYSGSTGYATGPHLHFTVYATQGVKVIKFENSVNCKNAHIPVADKKAYLNPLSYL